MLLFQKRNLKGKDRIHIRLIRCNRGDVVCVFRRQSSACLFGVEGEHTFHSTEPIKRRGNTGAGKRRPNPLVAHAPVLSSHYSRHGGRDDGGYRLCRWHRTGGRMDLMTPRLPPILTLLLQRRDEVSASRRGHAHALINAAAKVNISSCRITSKSIRGFFDNDDLICNRNQHS
ncbi:hypothetical protein Trydic_g4525 [Trypoxylus dichotomus]